MNDLLLWFEAIFDGFPALSWLKYVFMGLMVLIAFDAVLNLVFSAVSTLFRGK